MLTRKTKDLPRWLIWRSLAIVFFCRQQLPNYHFTERWPLEAGFPGQPIGSRLPVRRTSLPCGYK